ncbi:Putative transcriptional regulator%2C TetR family [Mycobacterium tuberculosis]|nr:Putative transcriptional regulator%2C TetR family [Mycobacterium tuberculosis]
MEKTARDRLVTAALALLGREGAGAVTVRAVENQADLPHGSVRHHFGGLNGMRQALVRGLLKAEQAEASGRSVTDLVHHWTGEGSHTATARYEVMLMATRDPALRKIFLAARDRLAQRLTSEGIPEREAATLLAMLDGIVLDAILRRREPDLCLWQDALARARRVPGTSEHGQPIRMDGTT